MSIDLIGNMQIYTIKCYNCTYIYKNVRKYLKKQYVPEFRIGKLA